MKTTTKKTKKTSMCRGSRARVIADLAAALDTVEIGYPYFGVPEAMSEALKYLRAHTK